MSTINHFKSSSRAISNANYLVAFFKDNADKTVPVDGVETKLLDIIIKKLTASLNNALALVLPPEGDEFDRQPAKISKIKEKELENFVYACCSVDDLSKNYFVSTNKVKLEVKFAIDCTNPFFRNAASELIEEGEEIHRTTLFKCYEIGMLNRKLAVLGEVFQKRRPDSVLFPVPVPVPEPNPEPLPIAQGDEKYLLMLWFKAQRARSGTFGTPYRPEDHEILGKPTKELAALFEKAQKRPMCPFNTDVHRRRKDSEDQNERYLLGIGAGANQKKPSDDSTLGLVEKALGLPERCDISGTTTDAVGVAKLLCKPRFDGDANFSSKLLVLSCIVSMDLQGHHSLDEMGAALSLSDRENYYNPLDPMSLEKLFAPLYAPRGTWHGIGNASDLKKWLSSEWLVLSGYDRIVGDAENIAPWEFTDDNWRVWKMFANIVNAKPAP